MQNTQISNHLQALHGALIEIVSVMNRPQRDEALLTEAGVKLDRALFPLLVVIDRLGPIGVVDLAERVGRDHTTVSRQLTKLAALGLIDRQRGGADARIREAVTTAEGRAMTQALDAARERIGRALLERWSEADLETLARLLRRFADDVGAGV